MAWEKGFRWIIPVSNANNAWRLKQKAGVDEANERTLRKRKRGETDGKKTGRFVVFFPVFDFILEYVFSFHANAKYVRI